MKTYTTYTVKIDDENTIRWYQLHRIDGPELHRINGPAIEFANGDKYWYLNGEPHRTDGPAIEYADGTKIWYLNGKELTEAEFNKRTKSRLARARSSRLTKKNIL